MVLQPSAEGKKNRLGGFFIGRMDGGWTIRIIRVATGLMLSPGRVAISTLVFALAQRQPLGSL